MSTGHGRLPCLSAAGLDAGCFCSPRSSASGCSWRWRFRGTRSSRSVGHRWCGRGFLWVPYQHVRVLWAGAAGRGIRLPGCTCHTAVGACHSASVLLGTQGRAAAGHLATAETGSLSPLCRCPVSWGPGNWEASPGAPSPGPFCSLLWVPGRVWRVDSGSVLAVVRVALAEVTFPGCVSPPDPESVSLTRTLCAPVDV